ncbi:tRNA pseudouridine(38-40) synthase TruA [Aporhodopirellula aestuarii]|uniref:tRNA pseudouridine synthase A n=1 Tax=Aporhodopirellula aestuarii TaxID=2950107 RepID=A0ABT0U3B2_9BACT|nr:tRNA pseudouridine(38-40) synthase TruA [Aporhodopirellula aestuarii]MCM2371372.1 tRNA pseudouridine(38-40) synthase TruA [Aporhodopirellula aestuarii]
MNSNSRSIEGPPSPTFHLTVTYDGTEYSGWQVQPGRRTIQAELEQAVATLLGKSGKKQKPAETTPGNDPGVQVDADLAAGADRYETEEPQTRQEPRALRVLGSGRTDAGVHAWGQAARCVLPNWRADAKAVMRGLNSRLPEDITVVDVRETIPSFHPIADAIGKRYRYQIQIGGHRNPFAVRTRYRVPWPIDVDLLAKAAEKFLGCHDFAAFQASGAVRLSTVRTITHSVWTREPCDPCGGLAEELTGQRWFYEVEGDGFLYNMVRNLVGTMFDVARGYRPIEWIDEVLESKDRRLAGATAPPQGLFLCCVNYPNEVFLTPSLMFTKP